jgi:hypothetical protein
VYPDPKTFFLIFFLGDNQGSFVVDFPLLGLESYGKVGKLKAKG